MGFVNTLHYISNPLEEFKDFKFVSWEKEIYPKFKGEVSAKEQNFFVNLVVKNHLKSVIDFGVGGGVELNGLLNGLKLKEYFLNSVEANETDDEFIRQAQILFKKDRNGVLIHKANWLDLPNAIPAYTPSFDFGFLTGNSLTSIGGGTREYTKKAQQIVVEKFANLIKPGGYIFIDSRNYDYIRSLMDLPKEHILEKFNFDYSVYYHGTSEILVFPAYISETVVVLHYYDKKRKIWSKQDYFPIYQKDMVEILSKDFIIEKIYYDFEEKKKDKCLFVQYLARRK